MASGQFDDFEAKMLDEGLADLVVETFRRHYLKLVEGETGQIAEAEITPVDALPDADDLTDEHRRVGEEALSQTVTIKLNGGLGTSMGLEKAKSLLAVKDGLTFLDVISRQALLTGTPLVLMNSFATREDSLAALSTYPDLSGGSLALDFVQHKYPKIERATLSPARWPAEPSLEWNPPGHGDIYSALATSGMLGCLVELGYRYAFVSNSDNLGAVLDADILGYLVESSLSFLMETAERTEADRKGGHIARRSDGRLVLRELAQCPAGDVDAFQDVSRHRYFNTNTVWIDLPALSSLMVDSGGVVELPLIRNAKTVDPRDADSTQVYQLETAMGAAISAFDSSGAIRVPRTRFAPVKTTSDLLAVRSDAYVLTPDFRVVLNPARRGRVPVVDLDSSYYRLIDDLESRFPHGPPSLVDCSSFRVRGDVAFGKEIVAREHVQLVNETPDQVQIADDTGLMGRRVWSS